LFKIFREALETIHIELLLDQNKANFIAILSEIVKDKTANEILDAEAFTQGYPVCIMLCKRCASDSRY
jgi:serine O-acetyltransferase